MDFINPKLGNDCYKQQVTKDIHNTHTHSHTNQKYKKYPRNIRSGLSMIEKSDLLSTPGFYPMTYLSSVRSIKVKNTQTIKCFRKFYELNLAVWLCSEESPDLS